MPDSTDPAEVDCSIEALEAAEVAFREAKAAADEAGRRWYEARQAWSDADRRQFEAGHALRAVQAARIGVAP